MGIDVQLRAEDGVVLEEVGDDHFVLSKVADRTFSGTRLLKYLLPWGDAVFNQAQAPDLASDIHDICGNHEGTPVADHLRKIAPLVDRLSDEVHTYLWFVGD